MPKFRHAGTQFDSVESTVVHAPNKDGGSRRNHSVPAQHGSTSSSQPPPSVAQQQQDVSAAESAKRAGGCALGLGQPIGSSNVGYKLLQKAGWQVGTGLGAERQGRPAPVEATVQVGARGLGFSGEAAKQQQQQQAAGSKRGQAPEGNGIADGGQLQRREQQQQQHIGPQLGSVRMQAVLAAEVAVEDTETKVKRHRQVMRAEQEARREAAIRTYLSRAFNDPGSTATGDTNPLLQRRSRLTDTNPLLDDADY